MSLLTFEIDTCFQTWKSTNLLYSLPSK